jgi:hypothetical protein
LRIGGARGQNGEEQHEQHQQRLAHRLNPFPAYRDWRLAR